MNQFLIFSIIGYLLILLQKAIVLNVSNVRWTMKRLFVTAAVVYLSHALIFNLIVPDKVFSLESVITSLIILIFAYHISFKQSWRKSVFMVSGQYLFLSAGFDYTSLLIVNKMPESTRFFLLENLFIIRALIVIAYFLIFIYTRKFTDKEYSSLNYLISKYWAFYLAFFLFFATYDVIHMIELEGVQYVDNLAEAFAVALFIVLFLYSLRYVGTAHRLETTQHELESQKLYMESQQNTLDDLRGFKHGLKAVHNTMHALLDNGELVKLKSYMEEFSAQIKSPQTADVSKSVKKIPILTGILLEKIGRSELKGITLEIAIQEENIDLKYCSDLDYSQMISILLDNAIESAEQSRNKTVEFTVCTKNGRLLNEIINSCDSEVDICRIFDRGYSTKKNPSGEGLYQFRLIQGKYQKKGYSIEINSINKEGYFTQVLKV